MITTFPPQKPGADATEIKTIVQAAILDETVYEINYDTVETYADLPAADTKANETYIVKTATGTWLLGTQNKAGLYYSNGVSWAYMGNNVSIDDSITSNESVWSSSKTQAYVAANAGASGEYVRPTAMSISVGGAAVGTTFSGTILDALDKVLYPYQNPAFTSFYLSGVATTYELGDTMEGGNITFVWATSNSANVKVDTVNCNGVTGLANSGSSVQMLASVTKNTVSTEVYTISATNTKDAVFSRNAVLSWSLARHWGVSTNEELDDAAILALSKEFASSRIKTVTYDCTGGKYFYFAYPTSFGDLNNTKVNNLAWNDWVLVKRDVVNSFGVTIPFNIYRCYNLMNGSSVPVVWG